MEVDAQRIPREAQRPALVGERFGEELDAGIAAGLEPDGGPGNVRRVVEAEAGELGGEFRFRCLQVEVHGWRLGEGVAGG